MVRSVEDVRKYAFVDRAAEQVAEESSESHRAPAQEA